MKTITIGRSSTNTIAVNDDKASRRHCQIIDEGGGKYSITDLNSTNGTYVNERRISGTYYLTPNDVVRVGNTRVSWQRYVSASTLRPTGRMPEQPVVVNVNNPSPQKQPVDNSKVDMYISINNKYFKSEDIPAIRKKLQGLSSEEWRNVELLQYKDPTTALLLSLLLGLAIDRFYIGDTGLGIVKLLTCGGAGVWTMVDWFIIMKITKERNFNLINRL